MAFGPSIGLFVMFSLSVVGIKAENLQTARSLKSLEHRRLFVFGDSFADTGNKQNPDEPYYSLRKPYGETYPLYPTGRWSDGKVMTDFVAAYLDLNSPVPYTKRNDSILLQRYGMNFAYGGTGVFDTFTSLSDMTQQIDDFEGLINSGLYADHLDSSVALVSYAGNDYRVHLGTNGSLAGLAALRPKVVQQLTANLQRLHNLGVKRVAVTNLQPIGCCPTATYSTNFTQCSSLYNGLCQLHNQLLNASVQALSPPVVILDNYNAFLTVLQQETFGNRLKACCMGVNIAVWCGTVDGSGNKQYTLCPLPWTTTFWWDSAHPSHVAWKALVENHHPSLDQLLG